MSKFIDITGRKFGRLVVQGLAGKDRHGEPMWNCLCDCGDTKRVRGRSLKDSHTKSCGCYKIEQTSKAQTTHGHLKNKLRTLIYVVWHAMMSRCYNPNNKYYKHYGGRGIRVCERWHTFENFYADMGNPPEGMTLDRKDNDGDYCPENCRWATREEQNNNKRNNVWYEFKGEKKTVAQWERYLGMNSGVLWKRLSKGWSVERALTTPVKRGNNDQRTKGR